nr:MAG TPA: hypothetical protein [Caudoviricetes sp.]
MYTEEKIICTKDGKVNNLYYNINYPFLRGI